MKLKTLFVALAAASLTTGVASAMPNAQSALDRVATGNSYSFTHHYIGDTGMWMGGGAQVALQSNTNYLLLNQTTEPTKADTPNGNFSILVPYLNIATGYDKGPLALTMVLGTNFNYAQSETGGKITKDSTTYGKISLLEGYATYNFGDMFLKIGQYLSPLGVYSATAPMRSPSEYLRDSTITGVEAGFTSNGFYVTATGAMGTAISANDKNTARPSLGIFNVGYNSNTEDGTLDLDLGFQTKAFISAAVSKMLGNNSGVISHSSVISANAAMSSGNINASIGGMMMRLNDRSSFGTVAAGNLKSFWLMDGALSYGLGGSYHSTIGVYGNYNHIKDENTDIQDLIPYQYAYGLKAGFQATKHIMVNAYLQQADVFKKQNSQKDNTTAELVATVSM